MNKELKEEFLNHIKDGDLYDYMASNYYKYSKEELKTILNEFIYNLYQYQKYISSATMRDLQEDLLNNLIEYL